MDFQVKVKKLTSTATLPKRMSAQAAGLDISACEQAHIPARSKVLIPTGLAMSFPNTHVCFVKDRSGLAAHHGLTTLAGVIDADYRGEYKVVLHNTTEIPHTIEVGDRIAQLVFLPIPKYDIIEVDELDDTTRGSGAFGSSGR